MTEQLEILADMLRESSKSIAFTGAGVSTASGIPDFRSPGGVWTRYDPEDFQYSNFLSSEHSRERYWEMSKEAYPLLRDARPNPCHTGLARLERMGLMHAVVTQNIDRLHQRGGFSPEQVVELHGNSMEAYCLSCDRRYDRDEVQAWLEEGRTKVPRCESCDGVLKPCTISFGQPMPEEETTRAFTLAEECELCLSIGSSLVVYPAAYVPERAKRTGARLVIMNMTETPLDPRADLVLRGRADEMMAELIPILENRKGVEG